MSKKGLKMQSKNNKLNAFITYGRCSKKEHKKEVKKGQKNGVKKVLKKLSILMKKCEKKSKKLAKNGGQKSISSYYFSRESLQKINPKNEPKKDQK